MNLKELQLVSINGVLPGGSTRPLLVQAREENGIIAPYVLKLFSIKSIEQNFAVAKEIIVNQMAVEFDLPVPNQAVINFNHDILIPYFGEAYVKSLHKGYKYCSKFHPGVLIFNSNLQNKFLKDYDIGNVFAFDNFMLNVDRGGKRNKPNLLFDDESFILIDHELTLPFYQNSSLSPNFDYELPFRVYDYEKHIFWKYLKRKIKKQGIFDEFEQTLAYFDLNRIDVIFAELNKFNINHCGKTIFLDYILWCKTNYRKVLEYLKYRIT